MLVTDPRIVDNPAVIETITYKELRELAYMGATVLHEDALFSRFVRKVSRSISATPTAHRIKVRLLWKAPATNRPIRSQVLREEKDLLLLISRKI